MSNRETILAALRGAKACAGCARYGAVDPFAKAAVGCPECQAALADAVLAAIQPPGVRLLPVLDLPTDPAAEAALERPMACKLDTGNSRYNGVEMCAACSARASAATLARTREALAAAQARERELREAVAVVARWFGPSRRAMAECRTPQDTALAEVGRVIDAALAPTADTAALDAALRRARADALREVGATPRALTRPPSTR